MERIYRLDDKNIIIVNNNLYLTAAVVDENRARCRELLAEMDGPVVLIIDYREVKTDFAEIIEIMKGNQAGKRKDLNQRTFTIMVGEDKLVNMYRDSMLQPGSGAVHVPYFNNMDEAIGAAEYYLAEHEHEAEAEE